MAKQPYVANAHCLYLKGGKFDPAETNNLQAIFIGLANPTSPTTLVIHFHGGLVGKAAGNNIAQLLYDNCYGGSSYPVFFIWESGLKHALTSALPRIFGEMIFQRLFEKITQFAVGKIDQQASRILSGARAGEIPLKPISRLDVLAEIKKAEEGGQPFADKDPAVVPSDETLQPKEEAEFYKMLSTDPDVMKQASQIVNGMRPASEVEAEARSDSRGVIIQGSVSTLMSPEIFVEVPPTSDASSRTAPAAALIARIALGGARVLKRVIARFARRRDHGVHSTIVEEILREFYLANIGKHVWGVMKEDAQKGFGADTNEFGGSAFLEQLKARLNQSAAPKRMVLIGHSTGAIYICEFLKRADQVLPKTAKFDVIFLAPACDFKLLANTLHRYQQRIEHFRLFGMCDDLERAEFLLDLPQLAALPLVKHFYPGSLLYFVSGLLEDVADKPLVGMQRSFVNKTNYDSDDADCISDVEEYLAQVWESRVWSKENRGAGLASESARHGDFDNDPVTLQSLSHLIGHGF